ncbi:6-hydroxymethylpterin diphosphokinase MptE-like protein [Treponema sp.]|uniref:motility associated factor glycosyltransferase family protein n=1 Tax=Treponema sp. TaxID=166 RepID=UPI0025FF47EA|nr:6-hydroxymethylpterin diphosphokinase MptE-like protein [Treponema sp.]MBR4322744.1 motility associated factor glycosyltransferase family protein [Treponema sp.]
MNSIWNKNLSLFMRRFPALAKMFSLESEKDIPEDIPLHLLAPLEILPSKQNIPTAKEGGRFLHSAYNPLREAEQAASSAHSSISECSGCLFFSCGLGYAAIEYARLFPNDTIIIAEPDPRYFFTALSLVDFAPLFSHENFIIALGTGIDSVVSLVEHTSGLKHTALSENQAQSAHAADYFNALRSLIERNKRKVDINASTLEKFSKLWLKNTCRNINYLRDLEGISIFKDSCPPDLPCLILAAGPSLEEVLPHLAELKKRSLVIAVDTALRACLVSGVEPDFIVLTDPQYYAWRHIGGLKSPSSILITESAAYPAVFRFECKKIVLCASLFPLGSYIESKIGSKGALVAGGSVSTTVWDFARFIGAKEIFAAGLDLGYPDLQTHIRGSTFEEAIHTKSSRLFPAEKQGSGLLFGANMSLEEDYSGNKILTDSKMKMFAWWFESKQEEFKDKIQSYSLSEKSLKIPGFKVAEMRELLNRAERLSEKEKFLHKGTFVPKSTEGGTGGTPVEGVAENASAVGARGIGSDGKAGKTCETGFFATLARVSAKAVPEPHSPSNDSISFDTALENLKSGLEELYATARKGLRLADDGIKSSNPQKAIAELEKIDSQILHSEYKEIASLVFPAEKRLTELFKNLPPLRDEVKNSLQKSKVIYKELMSSITQYQKYL